MYVGLKQPRGDGERYVTPARAAAKETNNIFKLTFFLVHLNCFYTHLNAITIENCSLNMALK